jgi:hypothetical protein
MGDMSRRARHHAPLAPLLALFGVAFGVAAAACTAGDDFLPTYGAANGLAGMSPATSTAATGDDDGGGSGTGGGCVAGSTPALYIDGGTCSVSFSKDIEGFMSSPTQWDCVNSSCHGSGLQQPQITGTASVDYPVLTKYSMNFNRPYLNPCSTDPAQSSISCNLIPESCDDMTQMPEPIGNNAKATTAQLAMLNTWLQCGAPNN